MTASLQSRQQTVLCQKTAEKEYDYLEHPQRQVVTESKSERLSIIQTFFGGGVQFSFRLLELLLKTL